MSEVAAAGYLAGTLAAAERERFEEHLLGCEACWGEVGAAPRGRVLAESLREVAPQPLGERVRASVVAASRSDRRRRRRRPLVAVAGRWSPSRWWSWPWSPVVFWPARVASRR